MSLNSNGSQRTSKCGKNISDTLSYTLCATFLFLPHFEVICDLVLNRRAATQNLQCSSDICEPKYTRNTRLPNTRINVCIYAQTCIQYMRVCLISMYSVWANLLFLLFLSGHCFLPQSKKKFSLLWIRVFSIRAYLFRLDLAKTNILQLGTLTARKL